MAVTRGSRGLVVVKGFIYYPSCSFNTKEVVEEVLNIYFMFTLIHKLTKMITMEENYTYPPSSNYNKTTIFGITQRLALDK